ncbi:MAG: isoprenyl transferase [Tissierellia bacterium]|nr:isoprenyl transferase [Tissierellia bacterium]
MQENLPKHIGIILDGNGRWAKKKSMPRTYGHKIGSENVIDIVRHADKRGIKYLSLYAFSTENWKRPFQEVNFLMKLISIFIDEKLKELNDANVKLNILGDISTIGQKAKESIEKALKKTEDNDGLNLNIAINYGGRDEIVKAVKEIIQSDIDIKDVNEELISKHLYTKNMPDPDLIIRTGGEIRISNFLIYQLAYSEFYFTDVFWPDFDTTEFDKALENYMNRFRRYGGL